MPNLKHHIDFNAIAKNLSCIDEIIESGEVFSPKFYREDFDVLCDDEILEEESVPTYGNIIKNASFQKFKVYKRNYLGNEVDQLSGEINKSYEELYFRSDDKQYILYFISIGGEEGCQFIGLLDINKNYVVVGCNSSHPFIITNEFVYNNSDGSGPLIRPKNINAKRLLRALDKYYDEFSQDQHH